MSNLIKTILLISIIGIFSQAHSQKKEVGDVAPEITFKSINSKTYSYADFESKKILISFLNTTKDLRSSELISEYSQFKKDGFTVILVLNSTQKPLVKYKADFEIPYIIIADSKLKMAKAFGLKRRLRKKIFTADFIIKGREIVELSYGTHLPLYRINQF